jgi:glycosyltransferase involved in cell wall biosynthesis
MRTQKVVAVLPAYNAVRTLERTVCDIPKDWVDDIILVDDASKDATAALSRSLGIHTIVHTKNIGYGGNQKTCYHEALARGADIVVMVHPDHQYNPASIPALITPILEDRADAVFGSRMMHRVDARIGGMPLWKFWGNIILTTLENAVLGLQLTEYHSGFRAYSKKALCTVAYEQNSNDFVFDTEIIIQLKLAQMRILEIPIQTRYFPEASTIGYRASIKYALSIMHALMRYKRGNYQTKN